MPIPAGGVFSDALDIISLGEARTAIYSGADADDEHDFEIAQFITAVSRVVDDKCGPVVARTVTDEPHDGGCGTIILHQWPVFSITSVIEWSSGVSTALTAETVSAASSNGYRYDTRTGLLHRRAGWYDGRFAYGATVLVTYEAGRYPSTDDVDRKFKVAVQSILRRMWKREAGAWSQSPGAVFEFEAGSTAFFNAVDRMIDELLFRELAPPAIA